VPIIPISQDNMATRGKSSGFRNLRNPGNPVAGRLAADLVKSAGALRGIDQHNRLTRAKNRFSQAAWEYIDERRNQPDMAIDLAKAKARLERIAADETRVLPKTLAEAFRSWRQVQIAKHLAALQGIFHQRVIQQADHTRSQFLQQKRQEYSRAAPKQRALIMHEVWDHLASQVHNLALSQDQATAIYQVFSQRVAEEAITRAISNAGSAISPAKALIEIRDTIGEGRFPGLAPERAREFLDDLQGRIAQTEVDQAMQGFSQAHDALFSQSQGKRSKAGQIIKKKGWLQKYGLDSSHTGPLLESLKLRIKQQEQESEDAGQRRASHAAQKVLMLLRQGDEPRAMGALHLYEKQLGSKVCGTLQRLIKEPDLATSDEAMQKALSRIYGENWEPDLAGLLEMGVTPSGMPMLHQVFTQSRELEGGAEPDYLKRSLQQFTKRFKNKEKAAKWRGRFLRHLLEIMQGMRLSPQTPETIQAGQEAEKLCLAWLAGHWAEKTDGPPQIKSKYGREQAAKQNGQGGDEDSASQWAAQWMLIDFAGFSGLKMAEILKRNWLVELMNLNFTAGLIGAPDKRKTGTASTETEPNIPKSQIGQGA
jgi:hypothetical protein